MDKLLKEAIIKCLKNLKISSETENGGDFFDFSIEHPTDLSHGDYSSNVAMVAAKKAGTNPRELAEKVAQALEKKLPKGISKIEVAGPGFINFYLKSDFFSDQIKGIIKNKGFKQMKNLKGQKDVVEYTQPNPFKQFHIGHLMSNTIGESFSRILEFNGAKVIRVNYQGDIGAHVAKAIYGIIQRKEAFPHDTDSLDDKVKFLGDAYVFGSKVYEEDETIKAEIDELNKKIFQYLTGDENAVDEDIKVYYKKGRQWSLEHFEDLYKELGTKFDKYFFESEVVSDGLRIVREHAGEIFEKSDGATVFKGEKYDLHTRVFVNSKGVPTYESKDLGLAFRKEKTLKYDKSFIVTAVEQKEYMKVVYKAIELIDKKVAEKTTHISHGMMRFADGKMSSRKGNIVTGESMIEDMKEVVLEKMKDRDFDSEDERKGIAEVIAIAAIKYSILKQSPGKDIVFDRERALSFEGDSGPYLQYTYVRAKSILEKAKNKNIKSNFKMPRDWQTTDLEKTLYRLPEVIESAYREMSPQYIATYLTDLSSEFNSFYANNQIIDENDLSSGYKIAITEAVGIVLKQGLDVLGIKVPNKM